MGELSSGGIAALMVAGVAVVAFGDIISAMIAAYDRSIRREEGIEEPTVGPASSRSGRLRQHARRVWRRTRMARGWSKLARHRARQITL